ncbi:MAG: phosphodiester glycosidase family protein [Aulosira sp. ZfuVER01]|nr:phosphodiester glycosidase family protein [Aulosira sp. ZfuVER01]MDZ7999650.1 phosphodiester glycosidase family protein [Aulosira sp. DedVER01a]MDZ8054343.1 phosphodiester glycosidase family protein [Aulosira sp. ZfuCHP01]
MPNCDLSKYRTALVNQGSSRVFWTNISPIIVTALCLYTTSATNAQQLPTLNGSSPTLTSQTPKVPIPRALASGNQISLNGRTLSGAWLQRPGSGDRLTTHLSDGALRQLIGVDLLNTNNPARQPVEWFSASTKPVVLSAWLQRGYRYLDITNFAQTAGWQIQANGNILVISTPAATVKEILQSQQPLGISEAPPKEARIFVDLDRPTPWQVSQELPVKSPPDPDTPTPKPSGPPNREWKITLDGIADSTLIQRYTPLPTAPIPRPLLNPLKQLLPTPVSPAPTPEPLIKQVEVVNNQTIIHLSVPFGMAPRISTLANPNRLVIDIRPDALVEKNIAWAKGLQWRQQFFNLGKERFPIVWLEINPRAFGITLKPMRSNPTSLAGTAPLIQTAPKYSAVAAINGGYFNRNNRLPLGAIRQDGEWVSGPILNRGAIAWNDSGQFYFDRLTLEETLIAPNNLRLPILFLNSGYVQSGIARYTPVWGATYTPLTDNEIIITVQKDQVTNQLPGGKAGQTNFPIPQDGYLLTLRSNAVNTAAQLPIGTALSITSATIPSNFSRYSNIIGAGPLLVKNRQIVLDAKSEKFGNAFIAEKAIRSGICTNTTGNLMIAAVHNRAGGPGPTLAEHAQLMQLLGCVDALNLDGGSSTSLYLGGQLIDRSPSTAARVHNGIGIFLEQK